MNCIQLLLGTVFIIRDLLWQRILAILCISMILLLMTGISLLTLSDPGYFKELTIRGALKAHPPPPSISKNIESIFTISYMCILPGVLGMFNWNFSKIRDFDHDTDRSQNKK